MIASIASHILALSPWAALLVVFALPALESSVFVGFVFPGEIALILGGVLAHEGTVPLIAVLVAGIAGAIVGDSVGYAVGRRFGRRILAGTLGRMVADRHLRRAERYLAERGGKAVFVGRFTAALRVLMPGLAGMSGLPYRTFAVYNVTSAIGWGVLSVMLGYLGGSSWQHAAQVASRLGLGTLAAVGVFAVIGYLLHRRRSRAGRPGADVPPREVSTSRVVVVIPTYDEAGNVTAVLDRVRASAPGADVLVVDDGSPDGTAAVVAGHPGFVANHHAPREDGEGQVFLLSRTAKDGLGAAYRAGFDWALGRGYDAVVQMDADLSHPPERIPALLQALERADVAVGSRYVHGGGVDNWAWSRRLISRAGNLYVRRVLGLRVHDTTAGFKAFRREALLHIDAVQSNSDGYCFQVENTWRAERRGLSLTEVPITFTDRTVGDSKMSGLIVAEALTRVLTWRWHELRDLVGRLLTREVLTFLAVGGTGYVVDVVAFNLLLSRTTPVASDPTIARTLAAAVAMCVTYVGNRTLTWGGHASRRRRREVCLFVLFSVIGLGFSVVCLDVSHHVLGLTSRLADNISANVVGLALGTAFRYVTYKRFVFTSPDDAASSSPGEAESPDRHVPAARSARPTL